MIARRPAPHAVRPLAKKAVRLVEERNCNLIRGDRVAIPFIFRAPFLPDLSHNTLNLLSYKKAA